MIVAKKDLLERVKELKEMNDALFLEEDSLDIDILIAKSELLGQLKMIEWLLNNEKLNLQL